MSEAIQVQLTPNQRAFRRFRSNRAAWISIWFLLVVIGGAWLWGWIGPYSASEFAGDPFQTPGKDFWFGSDAHGRDLLARMAQGARISMWVGLVGALVSLFIGATWGAASGLIGGRVDHWMMRFVDVLYSLPSIIFVIVLITSCEGLLKDWLAGSALDRWSGETRMILLFLGLGAVSWLNMARIVRGQTLTLRNRLYVDAARVFGAGPVWILKKHILPNVSGVIIAYLTLTVPSVILYESFLSYLGLGVQPPDASLGSLIAEGASQINPVRMYWWLIVFPGVFLSSILIALNFVGDGLRDAFDPSLEG